MASDDNNPRRNNGGPEDNPFIAFRRFADAQVGSLLSMVLTLPATMADFTSQRQRAHYQCLFGRADPATCRKLLHLEDQAEEVLEELQEKELTSNASLEEQRHWAQKHEEVGKIRREIAALRKEILGDAYHDFPKRSLPADDRDSDRELVERVANKKGQQWAWEWAWEPPKPFDENEGQIANGASKHRRERPEDLFDQLGEMFANEVTRMMKPFTTGGDAARGPRPFSLEHDKYSPRTLENDERLRQAGVPWRDAFEDLMRTEAGAPLIPKEQLGESNRLSYHQWIRRFWDPSFGRPVTEHRRGQYPKRVVLADADTSDELSYEYGHDHEDQHDEPPYSRSDHAHNAPPQTELDAYERLLGSTPSPTVAGNGSRPSAFSTLTTTERTMAPDGTVTTRTVLKKRFADGREETSETVHTEQAHDNGRGQSAIAPSSDNRPDADKKKGWFWTK